MHNGPPATSAPQGAGRNGVKSGPDRLVVAFARQLRAAGLAVPVGSVTLFTQALGLVGMEERAAVYWAGRATLVRRLEDLPVYDRVFAEFWDARPALLTAMQVQPVNIALDDESADDPNDDGSDEGDDEGGGDDRAVRYSKTEVLGERDFADLTPEEWAEVQRLIARMRVSADPRRTHRLRPDRSRSAHPDIRTTVRRSLRTGGVPLSRAWRKPSKRPRRLVLLVDISGSMEPYARALLRFAHAAMAAGRVGQVEVFSLGTRLTRLTRELAGRDPDAALARAADSVVDWSGGTRLGEGLAEFNNRWGTRGMARGAVVVILSDGWDRGDPEELGTQMERLHRAARRVVWANPLKASPGYAPIARGMAAALPFVDEFVEGHTLSSLDRLAAVVAGVTSPDWTNAPNPDWPSTDEELKGAER
jgi:uncharacterized protein